MNLRKEKKGPLHSVWWEFLCDGPYVTFSCIHTWQGELKLSGPIVIEVTKVLEMFSFVENQQTGGICTRYPHFVCLFFGGGGVKICVWKCHVWSIAFWY